MAPEIDELVDQRFLRVSCRLVFALRLRICETF